MDCAAVVGDRRVGKQVGDPAEVGLAADRQLERSDAGAEPLAQLVERPLEVGAFAVELVDEDQPRDAELGGDAARHLGLHLDALDRAHDEHGEVGHGERRLDLGDEVGVARACR